MELQKRDYKRDRKIVELRSKEFLYKQIGEILGITPARVGQLYRRAVKEEGIYKKKYYKKVVHE